jgi:plastocyanin domain-containing protein
MAIKKVIFTNIIGLVVLLFTTSTGPAISMSSDHSMTNPQFRPVEQPLALKAIVTLGGLGLIGLELWWFLFSQPTTKKAESDQGIQSLNISVDGGYEPALIVVKSGQLVRLNFFRKDTNSCLGKVLFPDFQIAQDLPLNQVTTIEFTPNKPGKYSFTCGMNMFRGEIEVQA